MCPREAIIARLNFFYLFNRALQLSNPSRARVRYAAVFSNKMIIRCNVRDQKDSSFLNTRCRILFSRGSHIYIYTWSIHRERYVANTVVALSSFFPSLSLSSRATYRLETCHYSRGDKEKEIMAEKEGKGPPFRRAGPNCGRCHDKYRFPLAPYRRASAWRRASSPTLPMLIAAN